MACRKVVCAECATRWDGIHYCAECLAARRSEGPGPSRAVAWASWGLAVAGLLVAASQLMVWSGAWIARQL